jgi:UDP-N-acetylglucosamine--N-acetylmuramyl-(pentapeptide) pyrophosphoryl-undecaprenol N-acetylglucosamine transferase
MVLSMSEPIIFFAGGGTGGHLYPGVAVAEALRKILPQARSVFLTTSRPIDQVILKPTGFDSITQPIVPPQRSISGLLRFWRSWRQTHDLVRTLLKDLRPALVLGLGGYAAGVAVKLASKRKIPTTLMNPDVIPGKANQYLLPRVQKAFCQFEQTVQHVPAGERSKLVVTGCPIRADLQHLPERAAAMAKWSLNPELKTLVVTGASQGAKTVNEAVVEVFGTFRPAGWQVLHLAGQDHGEAVAGAYQKMTDPIPHRVIPFTSNMADVWAIADLAVSRSGASSCAELTACGVPSILLPYPFHKDMHQRLNAQALQERGAAELLDDQRDAKANAQKMQPILQTLMTDESRRRGMASAAKNMGHPGAADAVAAEVVKLIGLGR